MGYLHVEIVAVQSPKRPGHVCGDVVRWERRALGTTLVSCDGLGSGIGANLAASMFAARLLELERGGASLRDAFGRVAATVHADRGKDMPYAALAVARILNNGETTVLTYESPPPILLGAGTASVLTQRSFSLDSAVVGEAHCQLEAGEGILVVSDGITQSGIGSRFDEGWGIDNVARFACSGLERGTSLQQLPDVVHRQALQNWGRRVGDDCSATVALCRPGKSLTILTGPPRNRDDDRAVIRRFLAAEGYKVVCGATTAKIVARQLGVGLEVNQNDTSVLAPPRYSLQGIDLVTEGAITLNQVYNILEEDPERYEEDSGVTELCDLLQLADRVHFIVGCAHNPANQSIAFQQRGILARSSIVPLLRDKLEAEQKLVVTEFV